MIDPITAVAAATKSFAVIKACVEMGKSAEDTMMQIGTWYGHASDVLYAEKKARNVNPFKRVVFSKSVEAEAVKAFAAKKKIEAQRKELLSLIGMAYGKEGLNEYMDIKRQIARERQEEVYRQEEMMETLKTSGAIVVLLGIAASLISFILSSPRQG